MEKGLPMRPGIINVMMDALKRSTHGLLRDFGEIGNLKSLQEAEKFVHRGIERAEKKLHEDLLVSFPDHNFYLKQKGPITQNPDQPTWIVSVLEGEKFFMRGIPHFAFCMAHVERGRTTASLVYDPVKNDVFWAAEGYGAFLDKHRIKIAQRTHSHPMLIACSPFTHMSLTFQQEGCTITGGGNPCLDMCYVSAGRYDGCMVQGCSMWTMASALLILKEASVVATDFAGEKPRLTGNTILAGTSMAHHKMLHLIRAV